MQPVDAVMQQVGCMPSTQCVADEEDCRLRQNSSIFDPVERRDHSVARRIISLHPSPPPPPPPPPPPKDTRQLARPGRGPRGTTPPSMDSAAPHSSPSSHTTSPPSPPSVRHRPRALTDWLVAPASYLSATNNAASLAVQLSHGII